MQDKPEPEPTLAEMEEEVLKEGREWTRRRLEQKLQGRADGISQSFSPRGQAPGPMSKKKADAGKQRRVGWRLKRITGRSPAVGAGFVRSGRFGALGRTRR